LSDNLTIMCPNELRKSVRRLRLSEEVCLALEGAIARGELQPGEQLPAEKVLARTFGVSRAVVREAVARLRADGRVETRQGAGAFVTRVPKCINFRFWQGDGAAPVEWREIFELRAMIESSIAELAARRRLPDDLVAMRRHLAAMDDSLVSGSDGSEADDDFHLAIAAATHNGYAHRLLEFMGRLLFRLAAPGLDAARPGGRPAAGGPGRTSGDFRSHRRRRWRARPPRGARASARRRAAGGDHPRR
jgi:GntR family transcriptional repressor for pyruvate dehydrogenase complex